MPSKVGYSNSAATQVVNKHMAQASQARLDAAQRIGSGTRINSASDNAANIAIAMAMDGQDCWTDGRRTDDQMDGQAHAWTDGRTGWQTDGRRMDCQT